MLSPSRLDVLSWLEGRSSGLARSFCGSIRGGGVAYTHIYIYTHICSPPDPRPQESCTGGSRMFNLGNSRNTVKLQIFQNPGIISRPVQIPLNLWNFPSITVFCEVQATKDRKAQSNPTIWWGPTPAWPWILGFGNVEFLSATVFRELSDWKFCHVLSITVLRHVQDTKHCITA